MRRILPTLLIGACALVPVLSSHGIIGYAQTAIAPQGDEFNADNFTAPFTAQCGKLATGICPDPQSATTWSLNGQRSGYLRIMTQFGSLVGGPSQSSNNARNLVLQPFDAAGTYTATTSLTFPFSVPNAQALGQTAGLLVYGDDDHFIYLARKFVTSGTAVVSEIEFLQENGAGNDLSNVITETGTFNPTVYLRLVKTGSLYQAYYSYDNQTFTAVAPGLAPTATPTDTVTPPTSTATTAATNTPAPTNTPAATSTSTPTPIGYTATFTTTPQFGVFAWGGTNATVTQNVLPADFDWFRLGPNSLTPVPTATSTATGTPGPTNTSTPVTPTSTAQATSTATATAPATATATSAPAPTDTPVPTPTPKPPKKKPFGFAYASVWYHYINVGHVQHIQIQDKSRTQDGIWVTVQFARGKPLHYYQETDKHGFWSKEFRIPAFALGPKSGRAVVTFQLWKGHKTTKTFGTFTVIK